MHYYQFNIGDYKSHTSHLDPLEDIAYRRMLDWCYLHEKPLPPTPKEIARLTNMRTHCDSITNVLKEFFHQDKKTKLWHNNRIDSEITAYKEKSEKASQSAKARWNKGKGDANALRPECERNAKHKPLNINHKPLPKEINAGAWGEFEQHRKDIRKPLSDLARTKAQNTIKNYSHEEQANIIDKTIQNRWTGLFPEKSNGTHKEPVNESNHSRVMRRLSERHANE
jgi:uncharacterized protein YdaU (DUF1376 family)